MLPRQFSAASSGKRRTTPHHTKVDSKPSPRQGLPAILWLPYEELLCRYLPLHILRVLPEGPHTVLL